MAVIAGNVTVTSVSSGSPVTGVSTGLSGALFAARYPKIKTQMDAADAAASSSPALPDPDKVTKYIQGIAPFTYGSGGAAPDMATALTNVAGFVGVPPFGVGGGVAPSWPTNLCIAPPSAMNRLSIYQGLAADCVVWASAIVPYFTANAVIAAGTFAAGATSVTGTGVLT